MIMTTEQKAKAYDEAKARMSRAFNTNRCTIGFMNEIFPELNESEDERIKKEILGLVQYTKGRRIGYEPRITQDEMIAWLEKQSKSDKSLYIRFGDIPINGKSKIYNGEIEIGIEEGISVYPAFKDKEGSIILGLNLPITKTSLHTQQHLLEYESRPCYLVTGDYVGKGTDGEPLIKNVRIIEEIKAYRIKQDKENNTYIINNTPNCGISVYNEELAESEDEKIRKNCIHFLELQKSHHASTVEIEECINWLEKQGKQNFDYEHADIPQKDFAPIEPKFKVGDFIVDDKIPNYAFCVIEVLGEIYKVVDIDGDDYRIPHCKADKQFHRWTIADANDGDVLVDEDNNIGLYSGEKDDLYWHSCIYLGCDDYLRGSMGYHKHKNTKPATKEQRELLFQKIQEAGYEWKQEEKKLIKINEPKFKVGDFIVNDYCFGKVIKITDDAYLLDTGQGIPFSCEHNAHLWTIVDAKDGDVLVTGDYIFIFKYILHGGVYPYCHYDIDDEEFDADIPVIGNIRDKGAHFHLATEEQRDLLFAKMKEAGYEWDAEKKILKRLHEEKFI